MFPGADVTAHFLLVLAAELAGLCALAVVTWAAVDLWYCRPPRMRRRR